jgi:glycosyltransferase involved in cell wall biosynthesis
MTDRLALVHDYITQRGGAEKVVLAIAAGLGIQTIHTSFYDPENTYPEFSDLYIVTTGIDRLGFLRRSYRAALPLYPLLFSRMEIDAAVTICSTSGWAHGVRTRGRKIAYCHSPPRWLYQTSRYLGGRSVLRRGILELLRPYLSRYDLKAAASVDRYIANSSAVQKSIRLIYGIEAEVLHPPPGIDVRGPKEPIGGLAPGFFLCVSRLLPYKNVTALAEAFALVPEHRLVVVGTGPLQRELRAIESRSNNLKLIPSVTEPKLRWLYENCHAAASASFEDFGLVPIEAGSFGKPSVVLRWGGFLDTVVEGVNGVFFDFPVPGAISRAVREAAAAKWDRDMIISHAAKFGRERFVSRLKEIVKEEAKLL